MKKSYEERGIKFGTYLAKLFQDCDCYNDFRKIIMEYNRCHTRKLKWASGFTRIAIIRADYVIKFTYRKGTRIGDCESERAIYVQAEKAGMAHLFAKTTLVTEYGLTFAVMPKINGIGNYSLNWREHCTWEEQKWINAHVIDLHEDNVGYRRDKVCIVDYAYVR
ncbi:MAG: hypothetical protein LIR50_10200 [Bacillota bacterium]|nr:hypothetical protein [Bacillota bacterium]